MLKEFKEFAIKGNVIDMAVGVIIGGAFGKIVTSIVNDLIMPLFGFITAGMDFKTLKFVLSPAILEDGVVKKAEAAILYGNFIQNVIDFLIIAFSIFMFIKVINKMKNLARREEAKEEAEADAEEPKTPSQEELLTEIRDLLQKTVAKDSETKE